MRPVRISGRLVSLRELEDSDAPALHAVYGNADVCRFMSFTPRTLEQCGAIIAAARKAADADPRKVYMLAVEAGGEMVGACRLGLEEWDAGQVGLALRPDRWHRGLGTETLRLLQRLGFGELGLHRIWGARSPRNEASGRLLAAAGMTLEGHIPSHVPRHGTWEDSITASITRDVYSGDGSMSAAS